MKKILLMALIIASGLSMISCTAEAVEDAGTTPVVAEGEPATTPIKPPPPPFP
ncbi:hypothetical protein J2X31_003332 [Flavobacterium arsenatis]|uniref:Uncharacterized protein n=1 Tax=Flavobacterium arsenatis TaxID=1484332 RepID=A0ABU1TU06_9FLAO|nr:hypothetical protein [Flavobacterium arsenatis]MDR6969302.1 hypothetical protein [Flavobacterium arsenatis]